TRSHVPNSDRAILPDDIVRQLDRALNHFGRRIVKLNIDLARRLEHAKAACRSIEERDERLRENVLARVLLHVVQPARPIDSPSYHITATRRRARDHVQHTFVTIVDTLHHAYAIERAGITRLTAAGRIKRSAIENECGPATDAITDIDDASFKLNQMRIGIVKTLSYSHTAD